MAILRAEKNTHGLPTGEPLRRELARLARVQRKAVLQWARSGGRTTKSGVPGLRTKVEGMGVPLEFPGWDWFGLGRLKMSERIVPLLRLTWDAASRTFASAIGLDPDVWEVVDRHTARMIETQAITLCDKTLDTTGKSVERALAEVREQLKAGVVDEGESVRQLTRRIADVFEGAETWRARRIAQTETSRAVHAAQEQTAIASGVVAGWRWRLSEDACPMCRTVARRAPMVKLGQAFAVVSDDPHYGTVKFPPLHPHCNCTVEEVLDVDAEGASWSPTLVRPRPEAEDRDEPPAHPGFGVWHPPGEDPDPDE